jgi:tRNA (guanine37-N1)-methyltransferase
MKFTVVTLFPDMFAAPLAAGVVGKAIAAGLIEVAAVNPRDFTSDRHRTVDDTPYGGGPGMVMKPEPLVAAIEQAGAGGAHRILLSPAGRPLDQARVRELAALPELVIVCGRYEGVDERVAELAIDEELSLGDFVLSGGEPAALALIDAVARHVPGVLGEATSTDEESFEGGLLEYPQYTRPAEFRGMKVPEVLLSGNHQEIARWRDAQSLQRTQERRQDLLDLQMNR